MEWLKVLLGEELYNQVLPKLGDKKIILNDGSYIPVEKFNNKNEEVKLLKGKITDYESKNTDVEKLLNDNADLKTKYESLTTKYNTDISLKDKEILGITKKSILSKKLKEEGAVYEDLILKTLDLESIEIDGENLKNFDIKNIKEKYPQMFTTIETGGNVKPGTTPGANNLGGGVKQQLINKYNEAEKAGNFTEMLSIGEQIKKLE
jgi:hypothetical protein